MVVSLLGKVIGTFFAVILILRIPSCPKLSNTAHEQQQTLQQQRSPITGNDGGDDVVTAAADDSSSSSFFNQHHYAAINSNNHNNVNNEQSSSLTEQEEGDEAAAIAAVVSSSAFDRDLYRTLLYEPYKSQYACQPRGIHLSQFNNVVNNNNNNNKEKKNHNDDKNYRVSVTVSFLLTSRQQQQQQGAAAVDCGSALAAIVYGRDEKQNKPEGMQLSQTPPLQFNYTSLLSRGLYTSDWIHHITIPHLKAGSMERYWYRIIVLDNTSKNSAAADSLQSAAAAAAATSRRLGGDHFLRAHRKRDDNSILGQSQDHHFWTPPIPGHPTTLALVGDLGQSINSTKTMAHILQASLDPRGRSTAISSVLIAGDLSYADSDPYRWTLWLNIMEPLLRTTLLHTAAGNHEIEMDIKNGREFVPYQHYFRNPNRIAKKMSKEESEQIKWQSLSLASNSDSSSLAAAHVDTAGTAAAFATPPSPIQQDYNYGNSFYSFQHGLARIIVLNSYSDTTVGSVQYTWLVQELKQHAQTRQHRAAAASASTSTDEPWLIVSFHSPLYTTFLGHVHESQARRMKTAMEPLFVQYGVNLVISGHDHGYMRTHSIRPAASSKNNAAATTTIGSTDSIGNDDNDDDKDTMDNAQIDPTGLSPIYLTLGAAGNREHHAPGYRNPHQQEEWVVVRDLCDYGYGHLHLANATHARLRWIRDHVVPDKMTISDDVWIVNHHHHY